MYIVKTIRKWIEAIILVKKLVGRNMKFNLCRIDMGETQETIR